MQLQLAYAGSLCVLSVDFDDLSWVLGWIRSTVRTAGFINRTIDFFLGVRQRMRYQ